MAVPGTSNKDVVQKMLDLIVTGDVSKLDQIFSANWENHDPTLPPLKGIEGAKQLIKIWAALSNGKATIEDSVTEGDKIAVRFRVIGKHTGPLMGIAPTGKPVNILGTGIFRISNGKATDNWVNFDALGLLQQLGAVPPPKM